MQLHVLDTFARAKRPFEPRDPDRVTMYVCGPTVYDYAHIGNARPAVVFDVLFRLLRRLYGEQAVIYARNVTDVDDKINAKAAAEGVGIDVITARYEAAYLEDMGRLNVLPPTIAPHVTAHMDSIRAQIAALVEAGAAYAAEGHVLFDVSRFADYGKLSGRSLDDMIAGARVEVAPYKKNPHDFVLWKPSKAHEPAWDSPWGAGRPGWHIECSAMIEAELGFPVDIHGGGQDLVFPHHENELAQGRCAHGGAEYARFWMHNGFLTLDAEKMSKSLGNVKLLHDLVKEVPGEVVRWALLSAHYRAPLDWTGALLDQSRDALDRFYQALLDARRLGVDAAPAPSAAELEALTGPVFEALCDDLNTPQAYAALFALHRSFRESLTELERKSGDLGQARARRDALLAAAQAMGLLYADPETWFRGQADESFTARVEALLEDRKRARAEKNWGDADRIRDALTALGVEVMDGPSGATWKLKT